MYNARPHHYLFAYRVLPQFALSDPRKFFAHLTNGGVEFLRFFWNQLGESLPISDRVDSNGLAVTFGSSNSPVAVACITLPPPMRETEAYFAGFVYRAASGFVFKKKPAVARYLTLELGTSVMTGQPVTFLVERKADGSRANFGSGYPTDVAAFIEIIASHAPV